MATIRVSSIISASPEQVWGCLRDISSHTSWMDDARAIHFTSSRHSGVGTTFDCETQVGPIRLTDRMEVIEWREGRSMGIRHVGLVRGEGRFSLQRLADNRTRFTWTERLQFPWWLGGPLGGTFAIPILRRVWTRNLKNLAGLVER